MQNVSLAKNLFNNDWLMPKAEFIKLLPLMVSAYKGEMQDNLDEMPLGIINPKASSKVSPYYGGFNEEVPEGSIGIVPIVGPITKYRSVFGYGTERYTHWLKQAANNKNIKGIMLKFDSPGGTIFGTQTLVDAIKTFKQQKPIGSLIEDGMCCSAAYWVASATDFIHSSHDTNWIGCIGVYQRMLDFRGQLEKEGIVLHEIYSDYSEEKNLEDREALDGNYGPLKSRRLNPTAKKFIQDVRDNRMGKINVQVADPFKGALYLSQEALQIGLIDAIDNMDTSIETLLTIQSNQNSIPIMSLKSWFGGEKSDEKEIKVSAEELTQLRADMEASVQEKEQLVAQVNEMKTQVDAVVTQFQGMKGQLATVTAERDEWKQKAEAYGKQPGATPSDPTKTETDELDEGDDYDSIMNGLKHNQEADAALGTPLKKQVKAE